MKYFTRIGGVERSYELRRRGAVILVRCGDREHEVDVSMIGDGSAVSLLVDGRSHDCVIETVDGGLVVQYRGARTPVEVLDERERAAVDVSGARQSAVQEVVAVMPGVVVELMVAEGDTVEAGQVLAVLEAMKMQNPLQAEAGGVVTHVAVAAGDAVAGGALLLRIEPPASA